MMMVSKNEENVCVGIVIDHDFEEVVCEGIVSECEEEECVSTVSDVSLQSVLLHGSFQLYDCFYDSSDMEETVDVVMVVIVVACMVAVVDIVVVVVAC
jgi:hypothetical protein